MAAEQLQIQVSANVSNAVNNLNDLNKELIITNTAAVKTGTTGMQTLGKGANQANTAMINLGRTVSDAPFGFIGIANNIGPLVENFVSLKKESGSTGSALKQLGSSLAGPGGLIVGVQLVVAAIQFAQLGLSRWTKKTKEAKQEQDEIAKSIAGQYTQVLLLKSAYENDKSLEGRKEILKQLNQVSNVYFGNLKAEETSIKQLQTAYDGYINNLLQSFAVKQLEADLEPLVKQLAVAQSTVRKLGPDLEKLGLIKSTVGLTGQALADAIKFNNELQNGFKNLSDQQRKALAPSGVFKYNAALNESNKLWNQINELIANQSVLFSKSNTQAKPGKTDLEKTTELLAKYREELAGINWDEQNRGIDGVQKRLELAGNTLRDLVVAGVKETSTAFKQINTDLERFKLDDKFTRLRKVIDTVNEGVRQQANEYRVSEDAFQKANKASLDIANKNIKILLANYEAYRAKLAQINKEQLEQTKVFADTISGGLGNAFGNLFESIANGEDAFKTLSDSVKQLVFDLIRAVIQMTLVKAIANAIAPGIGGQAAGLTNDFFIRGDRLRMLTLGR